MFWKKRQSSSKAEAAVFELAEFIFKANDADAGFEELAKQKSEGFGVSDLKVLEKLLLNPPKESELYNAEIHGLGAWISTCQFAIFEIVFNLGEDALPFIRRRAWGEYDWTQGNAIELLIRFAANGIQREEILNEIRENFPKIRLEAQLYALQPLMRRRACDSGINAVLDELMYVPDVRETIEELDGNV